jgi:Leu/Phe-tRNA-protein transferase
MIPIESKFHHNNNASNSNLVNFASKLVKEATIKDCKNATSGNKGESFVKVCESADHKQESSEP